MKKQIWKFNLRENKPVIEMPKDSEILHLEYQNETLCIWALVNPYAEKEHRHFEIYLTGQDICLDMGIKRKYIGTTQNYMVDIGIHLFERLN